MGLPTLLVLVAVLTVAACQTWEWQCDTDIMQSNLALHRPAYSSSVISNRMYPSLAVDGNWTPVWGWYSLSCTNIEANPWWAVDLEDSYPVHEVWITNRGDADGFRLAKFYIYVTDNSPQSTTPRIPPSSDEKCAYQDAAIPQGGRKRFKCEVKRTGRYVIIQLDKTDYLELVEVEVYSDSHMYDDNLAMDQLTSQSSTLSSSYGESGKAVDANWQVDVTESLCTYTMSEKYPWWSVDLGKSVPVVEVWITNRYTAGDRLWDFFVGVDEHSPQQLVPKPFPPTYNVCKHHTGFYWDIGTRERVVCDHVYKGRYVIIQLAETNHLTLCEVEVYTGNCDCKGGPGTGSGCGTMTIAADVTMVIDGKEKTGPSTVDIPSSGGITIEDVECGKSAYEPSVTVPNDFTVMIDGVKSSSSSVDVPNDAKVNVQC